MNPEPKICPKCQGAMIQGFVPDFSHGAVFVGTWHEGAPEKAFWLGTKVSRHSGTPIGAFCCSLCGFLEFYADPQFKAR